jgi:hypothetical protein
MLVVSLAQSYESINHNPFTDALPNVPFQMREPFRAPSIMYDREMMLWREVCKVQYDTRWVSFVVVDVLG